MSITPTNPSTTPISAGDIRNKAQDVRDAAVDAAKKIAAQVKENHPTVAANIGERIKGRVSERAAERQTDRQARIEQKIAEIKNNRNDQAAPPPAPEQGDNAVDISA